MPNSKVRLHFSAILDRIVDGFGAIGKQTFHFLGRAEIELIGSKLHPLRIFNCFARLNAEKNLMGLGITPDSDNGNRWSPPGEIRCLRLSSINP